MYTTTSDIRPYRHKVQYYETDAMKIVHHAEYVLWMEAARNDYFAQSGFEWSEKERETGIMIPVLFQSVEYKLATRFGETIEIDVRPTKFDGVKMDFEYCMREPDSGEVKATGVSKHGFIDREYKPVMLQREYNAGLDRKSVV